jgi:hypothetical protein
LIARGNGPPLGLEDPSRELTIEFDEAALCHFDEEG